MKERLIWLGVFIICLLLMIVLNIKFHFYSWYSIAIIFSVCGLISYVALEKKIKSKNKKREY